MRNSLPCDRSGKVFVLVAILTPALFAVIGVVVDGSLMMSDQRNAQHASDAAATAAAMDLFLGNPSPATTATNYVQNYDLLANASVTFNVPPKSGTYRGQTQFVELLVSVPVRTNFIQLVGVNAAQTVAVRSVAGYQATTAGAGIVVLDPSPPPLSIPVIASLGIPLAPLPSLIGGLEVLGLGELQVQGAVLVNTQWGGVDQNGNPAGVGAAPPYAIACTPLVSLTKLAATDIRVVGGVDSPGNYVNIAPGKASPLHANKLPVPDPWLSLPAPTVGTDPGHVVSTTKGGVTVVGLPLIGPPKVLSPGVYDWIEVVSGLATFQPGVYIIRSVNPVTQAALSVVGGQVTADGVMFYITDSSSYDGIHGTPDAGDGSSTPPAPGVPTLLPSVLLNVALPGNHFTPISDPSSPFHGVMIYQRRFDRRPIVIVQQNLIGGGYFSGAVYAKWGHVLLAGEGTFNSSFTAGTMRVVEALDCVIAPTVSLPPAQDVFLME